MKKFKCHKEVEADKIISIDTNSAKENTILHFAYSESVVVRNDWLYNACNGNSSIGGYFVRYSDGYISWSPAEAFEEGYTEISDKLTTAEHTEAHGDEIKTYNRLTDSQIAAVNRVKVKEAEIADLMTTLLTEVDLDPRSKAQARTAYEQGSMYLIRAITQPDSPFD